MILVDSSVWIDFFRGHDTPEVAWLDAHLDREPFLVGDLILAEVLRGFTQDRGLHEARRMLLRLPQRTLGGDDIAVKAARHYRRLRSLGVTVRGTVDLIIATRCLQDHLRLLHCNADFKPFERHLGLRTVTCTA